MKLFIVQKLDLRYGPIASGPLKAIGFGPTFQVWVDLKKRGSKAKSKLYFVRFTVLPGRKVPEWDPHLAGEALRVGDPERSFLVDLAKKTFDETPFDRRNMLIELHLKSEHEASLKRGWNAFRRAVKELSELGVHSEEMDRTTRECMVEGVMTE